METAENNIRSMDSSPYPSLSNATSDSSKLCVDKSHESRVFDLCQLTVITAKITRIAEHIPETLISSTNFHMKTITDCNLCTAIDKSLDRDIVDNCVDIQHRHRPKTLGIILICQL